MAHDMKILVVDDEAVVRMSAERVLNAEGCLVESVDNGREAISKMQRNTYDIVITDLRMPEMDGMSLIKWIRGHRPSTRVLAITGYPSQETMKEGVELGIIDYVPKPFTPMVLKDVTHRALTRTMGRPPEKTVEEEFSPVMLEELDKVIHHYRRKPSSTIPVLQRAQEIVGYLPPAIQKRIARGLNVDYAEIHSIVSFYSYFTMKPRGDHTIKVCLGTACYVKGIETILERIKQTLKINVGETTEDKKFTLEAVRCVGACGLAPVMVVDQDTHGALTQKKAIESINLYAPVSVTASFEEVFAGE